MRTEITALLPAILPFGNFNLFNLMPQQNLANLLFLAGLIFVVELAFFFMPGISVSSLLIAMSAMHYGFLTTFLISIFPIVAAHFILIRNPLVFIPDIFTIIPMIFFGATFGKSIVGYSGFWGWSMYGMSFSFVKWLVALPAGYMFGGSIGKRIREIILEPIGSLFLFRIYFLFMFLF